MTAPRWFEDTPVVGKRPPEQVAAALRAVGETGAAEAVEQAQQDGDERTRGAFAGGLADWWPFRDRAWQHTAHAIGYLAPTQPGAELVALQHAGNIAPDVTLRHARVRITLSALRVADYPGSGTHRVLFDFYAQNQAPSGVEHLHFTSTFRAREGERAAVVGYPIFVGLSVGADGVAFKCFTVNVKNDDDEAFLGFLESSVFKAGLTLVSTAQPALAPFSEMAYSLTKGIAQRNRNVPVQDFYLGLDFTGLGMGARLAEGSYIAVQIPEQLQTVWRWDEWAYDPQTGQLVRRADRRQLVPYNYVVFGVSRYEGP